MGALFYVDDSTGKKDNSTGKKDNSTGKKDKGNRKFWALIGIVVFGILVSFYFTAYSQFIPNSIKTYELHGKNFTVILEFKEGLQVSIWNYYLPFTDIVKARIFSNDNTQFAMKDVKIFPNLTSVIQVDNIEKSQYNPNDGTWNYTADVKIAHPLTVAETKEPHFVEIFYTNPNGKGPWKNELIPFNWSVKTIDIGKPTYFWIIFAGVMLSRIFKISTAQTPKEGTGNPPQEASSSRTVTAANLNFTIIDILWIPFSAVITLLIFSSFLQEIHLGNDIISNLALAFGFGFGFDKTLEVWAKTH